MPRHRARIPFNVLFEFEGAEYEVQCLMEPVTPARISGPPEDCYPADGGEIEVVGVLDEDNKQRPDILEKIKNDEKLYEKALDISSDVDDDDGYADYCYDRDRDDNL